MVKIADGDKYLLNSPFNIMVSYLTIRASTVERSFDLFKVFVYIRTAQKFLNKIQTSSVRIGR